MFTSGPKKHTRTRHLFQGTSEKFIPLLLCTFFSFLSCLTPVKSYASGRFDISYILTGGGYILELSQETPSKGVKIDIRSDIGKRYEVSQRILTPLTHNENPGIVLHDALTFKGLRGSNRTGDLKVLESESVLRQEEILYVSNPQGESDSFTLVYGLPGIQTIEPGYYTARISFTITSIGSSEPPVTRIMEIHAIAKNASNNKISFEISTPATLHSIVLDTKNDLTKTANVLFKITGDSRTPFKIKQQVMEPLESGSGNTISLSSIGFNVKSSTNQTSGQLSMPNTLQEIYSAEQADQHDLFVISYTLGDISRTTAGRYRSRVQYYLEVNGVSTLLDTFDLIVEQARIFELQIKPQNSSAMIEFKNLKPLEPAQESIVEFKTLSNTGKRYQVNQQLTGDLTNDKGDILASKYFTYQMQSLGTKGKIKFTDWTEVKKGDTVLFISDNAGSPDQFSIRYELKSPADAMAGNYFANMTYTLQEL